MVCRDVLALMDRVSLVNGLQPVREKPMSLLEYTHGPRQMCGYGRLIAAPHSRRRCLVGLQ